ncbi:MAG: hypothetical protein JXD18_12050 [Anaerolineae bacterium]|nr:hypothetical protein [Anaerolineae bacterium]
MSRLGGVSFLLLVALVLSGLVPGFLSADPAMVEPLPPSEIVDGWAGLSYTFLRDPATGTGRPYLSPAYETGARWDRFDFAWPVIEHQNNAWVFGPHDELIADLHAAGFENLVGILLWTPEWASTARGEPAPTSLVPSAWASPPQGLDLDWYDPDNHWGNYVYNVVSHYGDRIKYWEMWNGAEWDYFWAGTDAQYARLLTVGYQATKAACPDCQVLFAGVRYWDDPAFFQNVIDILAADPDAPDNAYYFDIMSVHLFGNSDDPYSVIVDAIRPGMGLASDHPIWLASAGVPVWDDATVDPDPARYDGAATEQEAAAYVIQSYANALAAGVGRYFLFRTNDDCPDPAQCEGYFGVMRDDGSLRPAYVAYQVATRMLTSPTFTTRTSGDNVTDVSLWGTPHGKVGVVWSTDPTTRTYAYTATMPTATLVDRWGVTQTISAVGGVYTLTLPGATAYTEDAALRRTYVIGGDPWIVVETETANRPPTSTVHLLPELTYSTTFTVTWEGADDESGVWFYDLQVRDGEEGEWVGWQDSTTQTEGQFTGACRHTYCFRSRATDRLGNQGEWPEEPEACTTIDLTEFNLTVGEVFGDANDNGVRDGEEVTLTQVAFHFLDGMDVDVVAPGIGASWTFTAALRAGDYTLLVYPAGGFSLAMPWLPVRYPVTLTAEPFHTMTVASLGLPPAKRVFLPLVFRQ